MSAFKGFSVDQIQIGEEDDHASASPDLGPKRNITKKPAKKVSHAKSVVEPKKQHEIPPEALLSSPTVTSTTSSPEKKICFEEANNPDLLKEITQDVDADSTQSPSLLSKMEILQHRQKVLEDENKKKRQLLSNAIAARRQRTTEEAKKLQLVQAELLKMDVRVADDIKLLRKTIEDASIEYMEAQKRYTKAEKEFVDAKILLHNKEERKELLTEHLSAIIEDCEVRKAQKLSDLMKQLEIEDNCDSSFIETNGAK